MTIHQRLKQIGFNDKEIKVYLALLKYGASKPSTLVNMTKLNRATLYNIAQSLVAKGVVSEDLSTKTLTFTALPPQKLDNLISLARKELHEKEVLIKSAIDELNLISSDKKYPVPKIRFIEEQNLEKFLFDNLEKWQDQVIASDGIWWGYQDHGFAEIFEDWLDQSWKTKQSKIENYQACILSNSSNIERKLNQKYSNPKRKVRYIEETNFTATTWVCGDYLIMIMTKQQPYYLIEIHDQVIAKNTKEIFKKLWQSI